jgi:hypothetical protein
MLMTWISGYKTLKRVDIIEAYCKNKKNKNIENTVSCHVLA